MPVTTRFPSANNIETGAGLTSPNNAHANNGSYATGSPGKNSTIATRYGNFGFDSLIPPGARITKVRLLFEYLVSTQNSIAIGRTYYKISGAAGSDNDDTTEPLTETLFSFDVTADRLWRRADLLDGVFEAVLAAVRGNSNTAVGFSFDYIQTEVTWHMGNMLNVF